jgi:putative Holliday junction resolvase
VKYLGIDYGMKKTGLALGDSAASVAVPFGLIPGGSATIPRICEIVKEEGIEAFVVGLPVPTSPEQSPAQMERVILFIKALGEATKLPVSIVDEQFSSTEARRVQKEHGATASEDALAAMLILQAFFNEGPMVRD